MDLKQLKYFLAVVEHDSLSAAADALNVTHPALGQQIKKLEEELGVQLFERHSRGVRISSAGTRLITHAREIVEKFSIAKSDMAGFSSNPMGEVRIGVTPSLGRVLVPHLLELCSDRFPDLRLQFVQGFADHLEKQIIDQQLDVSIVHSKLETPHLESVPLFVEEIRLIGSPLLLAGLSEPVAPEVLTQLPLILDERGQLTRTTLENLFPSEDELFTKAIEVQAVNIRREIVALGTHCALSPEALFFDEIQENKVVSLKIDLPQFTRTMGLATPRIESMSGSVSAVREIFIDVSGRLIQQGKFGWRIAETDW